MKGGKRARSDAVFVLAIRVNELQPDQLGYYAKRKTPQAKSCTDMTSDRADEIAIRAVDTVTKSDVKY